MPTALLRSCSYPGGCPTLTRGSLCAEHRRGLRPTAHEQGYDAYWQKFRLSFVRKLIRADVTPSCGAALPTGPAMLDSRCKREGRLVTDDLQLDHEPPLRAHERDDRHAVCDPKRVGFLCASCHSRKTQREMLEGGRVAGKTTPATIGPRPRVKILSCGETDCVTLLATRRRRR